MKQSRALFVAQFDWYSDAVHFSNEMTKGAVELLELSSLGGGAIVLMAGASNEFQAATTRIPNSVLIDRNVNEMLSAYLGQENAKVSEHLIVAEDQSIAKLFRAAAEALRLGLQIVDFRFPRFANARGYLLLTVKEPGPARELMRILSSDIEKAAHVENPSAALVDFYSI